MGKWSSSYSIKTNISTLYIPLINRWECPPREMPVATGKAPVSVGMARLMTCENAMGTPWIPKVMACHGHEIMRKKTGEHEILFKKPGKG